MTDESTPAPAVRQRQLAPIKRSIGNGSGEPYKSSIHPIRRLSIDRTRDTWAARKAGAKDNWQPGLHLRRASLCFPARPRLRTLRLMR